ncbi:MAG: peptidoglycan DD-metalloendopeptidase family protein [Dehalococcoidia bacterium]
MSTRASGLADPADGLTASSAISVQRQQETVSAAVSEALASQGGSQSSASLAPGGTTPQSASTLGSIALRQPIEGATPPPAIASSQENTPSSGNNNTAIPAAATSTPTPTPTPPANVPCEPSSSPLYCVYEVQPGDNLGIIATKFNIKGNDDVTSWQLLVQSNRPDIVSEDDLLQIGQKLRIPLAGQIIGNSGSASSSGGGSGSAVVHTVLSAQTLIEIAERYGVTAEDIMAVPANGIGDPNALAIGKELIIPNPKRFSTPAPAPTATPSSSGSSGSSGSSSSSGGSRGTTSGPRSSAGLMWPVTGPISSYYGPAHPLGIDVDLFGNPNAPIAAAAAGVVTFAGGDACCSYGYYVVIDHGNGLQTLYAHFSKISVSVGERVSAGEIIGNGGRTGYATGNHLHFEVHSGGAIVNPLDYLP